MKYFTIFASKNDIDDFGDKIADVFAAGYKIEQAGNDYVIQSNSLFPKHNLTIRVSTEDTNPDYFEANIPGMMGFIIAFLSPTRIGRNGSLRKSRSSIRCLRSKRRRS